MTIAERIAEAAAKIGGDLDEIRDLHSWLCNHYAEPEARYLVALIEPVLAQFAGATTAFRNVADLARE